MTNRWTVPVVLALAVGVLVEGCATRFGSLEPTGYRHSFFAYRILRDAEGQFVSADWMVDNFYLDRNRWAPRVGPDFETELSLDLDGDGTWESAGTIPTYDLLLRNARDAGTMWARTLPLSQRFDRTELRVLARMYVESVSGSGRVVTTVRQATGEVEVRVDARRYATEILDEGPWVVGGYEAYRITFQVANVDQLSLSETSLWQRATLILVRAGFLWLGGPYDDATFPTILMLGYCNLPDDFEGHLSDFERFVDSVDWMDSELAEVRQSVLDCTSGEMVRVVGGHRRVRRLLSPDATAEELECMGEKVPLMDRSFAARRAPYEVPASAAGPVESPPAAVPEESSRVPVEGPAEPPGLATPEPSPVSVEPPGEPRQPAVPESAPVSVESPEAGER
ncbi:MAG: hypothetical protein JXB32_04610 [Deltaproteobacteria bacterium]|nr:hypothetical protein [Deltaproteobacteria bacterium]